MRAALHTRSQKVDVAHVTSKVNSGRSRWGDEQLLNHTSNCVCGVQVFGLLHSVSPPQRPNPTKARPLWFGPQLQMWLKSLTTASLLSHFLYFKWPVVRLGAGFYDPSESSWNTACFLQLASSTVSLSCSEGPLSAPVISSALLSTCPATLFPLSLLTCGWLSEVLPVLHAIQILLRNPTHWTSLFSNLVHIFF